MTETPPPLPQPDQAALEPGFRPVRAGFHELLHTLVAYSAPAGQHLDAVISRRATDAGLNAHDAVRDTPHFDAVTDWCREHPSDAARVVLCAIYLANSRFAVQEQLPPEELDPTPVLDQATAEAPVAAAAAEPDGS
jgi:hypothetical protein